MSLPARIPRNVASRLGYYVYAYVDPRTRKIFYVGKGQGQRALSHLRGNGSGRKARTLASLRADRISPRLEILAHGLPTEEVAFRVEAAVIDALGLGSLTNAVRGWRSVQLGRMPISDLIHYYAARPVRVRDPALLIRINRLYRHGMSDRELYETTRGVWKLGARRTGARLALAVFEGVVKEVYEIRSWHPAGSTRYMFRRDQDVRVRGRVEFLGAAAPKEVRARYVGRSVAQYFTQGQQSPVIYVGC